MSLAEQTTLRVYFYAQKGRATELWGASIVSYCIYNNNLQSQGQVNSKHLASLRSLKSNTLTDLIETKRRNAICRKIQTSHTVFVPVEEPDQTLPATMISKIKHTHACSLSLSLPNQFVERVESLYEGF